MKKTLITLLALAGVAGATDEEVQAVSLTATFNADLTATSNLKAFELTGLDLYKTTDSTSKLASITSGSFMADRLRPNSNVDSDPANSWTLDFTVSNKGSSDLTVNSITLSAFAFNGSGAVQTNKRNFLFTVSAGDTAIATDTNLYIEGSSADGQSLTITLTDSLTIAAKDRMTFSIMVEQGEFVDNGTDKNGAAIGRGAYLGLNTVTFNGTMPTPEPTTATLSLLALAGLAARRRRR